MKNAVGLAIVAVALSPAGLAGAQEPARHPNSERYRDLGAKPASNRSGSAMLTVQALLGGDGETEVTLRPGSSATGLPGGRVPKVQVKAFYDRLEDDGSVESDLLYTRNLKAEEGTSLTMVEVADAVRGQRLRVQANVTDIDPARTDVVTVDTFVHRRPDLAIIDRVGPLQARVGDSVEIAAVIREENGDLGATSDCVLLVDGVAVDRVEGMWIDAGSTVTAAFRGVFSEPGTHQIEFRLEGATPRDDDSTNDTYRYDLEIVDVGVQLQGYAYFARDMVSWWRRTRYESASYGYETFQQLESWRDTLEIRASAMTEAATDLTGATVRLQTWCNGVLKANVMQVFPSGGSSGQGTGYFMLGDWRLVLVPFRYEHRRAYAYDGKGLTVYLTTTSYDFDESYIPDELRDSVVDHASTGIEAYRHVGDAVYYGYSYQWDGNGSTWGGSWGLLRDLIPPPEDFGDVSKFSFQLDLLAGQDFTTGVQDIPLTRADWLSPYSWGRTYPDGSRVVEDSFSSGWQVYGRVYFGY